MLLSNENGQQIPRRLHGPADAGEAVDRDEDDHPDGDRLEGLEEGKHDGLHVDVSLLDQHVLEGVAQQCCHQVQAVSYCQRLNKNMKIIA